MLEVIDDRGLGLDKQLLTFYYLKRSKKGRRFPPRTVGLWFGENVMDDFGNDRKRFLIVSLILRGGLKMIR